MLRLSWTFDDIAALRRAVEADILSGRAFVPGAGPADARAACEVVLEHAGRSFGLRGEVVFVRAADPGRGVGVQLAPLDAPTKEALRAFASEPASPPSSDPASSKTPADDGTDEVDDALAPMHERLRHLSSIEQQKLASGGTLAERTTLERMYGPNVWEHLLRNQRITPPEVARIAKKGSLPKPLLEVIGANPSWLGIAEVQRALLSNPRTSTAIVSKILSGMSKSDLLRVAQQTAYPAQVRGAAKRMLGG